jgi:hypothetical protein
MIMIMTHGEERKKWINDVDRAIRRTNSEKSLSETYNLADFGDWDI